MFYLSGAINSIGLTPIPTSFIAVKNSRRQTRSLASCVAYMLGQIWSHGLELLMITPYIKLIKLNYINFKY